MSTLSASGPTRGFLPSSLAGLLGFLLWAPAAHAVDLTGHWRDAGNSRYGVVQADTSVTLNAVGSTVVCEGSIDGSSVELTCNNPNVPETYSLVLSGDESTLSGVRHTFQCVSTFCGPVDIDVTLDRCACFDGNSTSGDGCDLLCNVEACHECTGDPSTCTPVADATACEDPSLCVSGGTCSAGICAGGVETAQCIDLTDTWLRGIRGTTGFFDGTGVSRSTFVQDAGGNLAMYSLPGGGRERSGTFNPSTLALHMDGTGAWPYCGLSALNGTVTADGNSYAATGAYLAATPHGCFGAAPYDEFGVRCAAPALEAPDGCIVDSCEHCEGDPPVCEPVPDDTPCQSDDSCAIISTCQAGQCVPAFSKTCPACSVCDGAGGCVVGPRDDCRGGATSLSLKNVDGSAKRSLRWDWKDGGTVLPSDLARPDVSNEVTLCVFDESESAPTLLYTDSVNEFGLDAGWSVDNHGSMRFRSSTDAISSIDLRVGDSAKVGLKTDGDASLGLPVPALPLPLRAQLQIDGGACFEGSYGTDDVRRNSNGAFKARSGP